MLKEANEHVAAAWRSAVGRARGASIARVLVALITAGGGMILLALFAWQTFTLRVLHSSSLALGAAGALLILIAFRWGLDNRHYEVSMLTIGSANASYVVFLYRLALVETLFKGVVADENRTSEQLREIDQLLCQIDQDTVSALRGGKPESLDELLNRLT